jgi:hypothetical protein
MVEAFVELAQSGELTPPIDSPGDASPAVGG